MARWKLEGESDYVPHHVFRPQNLRKQDPVNGNWIINLSKEHSKKHNRNKNLHQEGLPAPKQNDEIKTNILTLKELLRNHGWPEAHLLTKARLFGGCYTDVLSEEMKDINLVTLDVTENYLNLDQLQCFSKNLEILEMSYNSIFRIRLPDPEVYKNLIFMDLSFNKLNGDCLASLGKLKSLQVLNLSGNQIGEITIEDGAFTKLRSLLLSTNSLQSQCFHQLQYIPSLQELYLNENHIEEIPVVGSETGHLILKHLKLLDLSSNPIKTEESLLPAASMPSLQRLIISNTILTQSVKGDPPLLKEYLTQRHGMAIQRQATEPPKKTPIVIQHPIIIQEFEPKVKKSTVDQRIKAYREEQAAIKHKEQLAIQNSKSQLQSLEKEKDISIDQKDPTEMPQDSFFLTQNLDEEPPVQEKEKNENEPEPTYESELSKITALAMREAELDLEQELTPIEKILELTEDEKVEYSYNVEPLSQTAAYNQLRALLIAPSTKTSIKMQEKWRYEDRQKKLDEKLHRIKNRRPFAMEEMIELLEHDDDSTREQAEMLYFDLKSKVEQVRINAIKDARALQGQPEEEL
ncbi:Oidioi.mRNA.OKI2018_I69.chr2.g5981.t1.cds [Oikopleura dioica]|uniref:Oidioi.mRNA.OKI2018_I69.chr2.g5981.t1.cds n=1 Tax=Oikopleura dioica TaxID=34765 RepID=A0ABN7T5I3_OIKDI|nr:Oidioi.mRNA.OKI2018_I69.chr2.g5981.t1.cds [Oikopleura dioica]